MATQRLESSSIKLLLILAYLLSHIYEANSLRLPNVYCSPHREVVQVDPSKNRYIPLFVKLHRCRGSIGSTKPTVKKCVATAEKILTLDVTDTAAGTVTTYELKNHTACDSACVKSKTNCNRHQTWRAEQCICECNYKSKPQPSPCTAPLVWNQQRCDCDCPTGPQDCKDEKKEWSCETCRCTCKKRYASRCARKHKVLDQNTCNCVAVQAVAANQVGSCVGSVKQRIVILIVVLEFLILVVMFALFYRFCLQREDSKLFVMTGSLKRKLSQKSNQRTKSGDNNTTHYNTTAANCTELKPGAKENTGSHSQLVGANLLKQASVSSGISSLP